MLWLFVLGWAVILFSLKHISKNRRSIVFLLIDKMSEFETKWKVAHELALLKIA